MHITLDNIFTVLAFQSVSVKTPVMKLTGKYGSKLTSYVETLLDGQSRAICNNWTLYNLNDQGLTGT